MLFPEPVNDYRLDSGFGGDYGRNAKYRDVAFWVLRVVSRMSPGIDRIRLWMPLQSKNFNDSIPNRLSLKDFFYRNAFQVLCFRAMQVVNHVSKLLNVRHAHASTRSPTLQKDCSAPAAIAGVQRSVL